MTAKPEIQDEMHSDVVEGGNYDVIRARLQALGTELSEATQALNVRREGVFGGTQLVMLGNERVRTENNCIPVDIVQVGGALLFGYNVHLGLKRQITAADVLSLHTFEQSDAGFAFHAAQEPAHLAILQDETFQREFSELYQYYKDARLIQLRVTETKLLAVFQTGATALDVKVHRWGVEPGGITYIDNRGERDHVYPPTHDFEWTPTTRADHVTGRHPHINVEDIVFVETVGGDLTVKVENNTEDGEGIYRELVSDKMQSLDDAVVEYAKRGALMLLKILPFREVDYRYLVFNIHTRHVVRIDAIGQSCVSLPEDHGILFPGGYYLRDGEYKVFDDALDDLEYVRSIKAPNGEDVLFVFHRRRDGLYALYPYNLIRKEIATPIKAHGYSLFEDGTLVVFRAATEPTRVHPTQIWQTPFVSAEVYQAAPTDGSLLGRIGNNDLVRGVSDAFTLVRLIRNQQPTREVYEELVAACNRYVDAYYWASEDDVGDLRAQIEDIRRTAELIIDEFIKVETLKATAAKVLKTARLEHDALIGNVRTDYFERVEQFLEAMTSLRRQRGHLITLQETRYVDVEVLEALEQEAIARFDEVSQAAVDFLEGDAAFEPLQKGLDALLTEVEAVTKASELKDLNGRLEATSEGVNLLAEVVGAIDVEDPTRKTAILDQIGEVFAGVNRVRAVMQNRRKSLRSAEGQAEFRAQFKLFGQSVQAALAQTDTPEACDDRLSRLLLQLEELEARFGDFDEFLPELAEKRDEVYTAFSSRKQTLVDERNRRIEALFIAAERILQGVARRSGTFKEADELNTYFASDPMVLKLRSLAEQLTALGDTVKADELDSKVKSARQNALRGLRDKLELFDGDENLVRFGKHRFSVNTQPLELAVVPRGAGVALHLTGTDFYQAIDDPEFQETKPFWDQVVVSETPAVYRAEYLAACMLFDAEAGKGLMLADLEADVLQESALLERVRTYAADRYDEGYDRGIHDADAARILAVLLGLRQTVDLLRFSGPARSLAALFWAFQKDKPSESWIARSRVLARLRESLGQSEAIYRLISELSEAMGVWNEGAGFAFDLDAHGEAAGAYLFEVLSREPLRFAFGAEASDLRDGLLRWLEDHGGSMRFEDALRPLTDPAQRFSIKEAWLETFAKHGGDPRCEPLAGAAKEAATLMVTERLLDADVSAATGTAEVTGLLGQHPRIADGKMGVRLSAFIARVEHFRSQRVPGFRAYRERRAAFVETSRRRLRVDEFQPKVMTAFVRNKLINDVYLHLVGDNLAKQMGAAGASKRTDLMGLLLLISPPGYGKTTLMEYIASRLGLVFVKVNGPALGHSVTSLDPSEAPNATARQEVDKVNLALEMGNNTMLYLDDIQHTHPEFLQKFISLCDASRRIEGVWNGRTRTYDLRGKKFVVVMAGNPYTESGDKFQIPDMLANRADTYNLGDILGGRDAEFALSFLENSMTSNAALQPLATREQKDVYALIRMARGEEIATSELSHTYSAVEISEIRSTFEHLIRCREVLLKVNAEYIRSAAMEDAYRVEPRFQLQGSYRNMNKLAEKVVPAMTAGEGAQLIVDHYQGEAQTLTTGAEFNLLRFSELIGSLDEEQAGRLEAIRSEYRRRQLMGGGDDDPVSRVTGVLSGMAQQIGSLGTALTESKPDPKDDAVDRVAAGSVAAMVTALEKISKALADQPAPVVVAPAPQSPLPAQFPDTRTPSPRRSMEETRQTLLAQADRILNNDLGPTQIGDDPTLAAAMSVIEILTVHLAASARARLPEESHEAFLEELRRSVASAVADLAGK